jgi:outer membrane protein OmpA-like peptidoglycan-associated protein
MTPIAFAAPRSRALFTALPLFLLLAPAAVSAQEITFGGSAQGNTSTPPAASGNATADATGAAAPAGDAAPATGDEAAAAAEWAQRDRQLDDTATLSGGGGILRVQHALTGEPGQFRLGFNTEWFSAGFLCSTTFPCPNPNGGQALTSDTMNHIGATMTLGITLARLGPGLLEGYASTSGYANSDTANRPALLQVLGDTDIGFKYGAPLSKIFSLGAFTELWLINGTGAVGLDGSGTSFKIGPIFTADLRGMESHVPLRFSFNADYYLNNTAQVVQTTEAARGTPITRIERFGLGIDRVDYFDFRLGGEAFLVEDRIRPFLEFDIAAPNNRQNYACRPNNPSGDHCLANDALAPAKITIGSRFYPWKHGFSLLAALDVGVGGTNDFIEEESPVPPWMLFIGAGWAVDTQDRPPRVVTKTVEKRVEISHKMGHVNGVVHDQADKNTLVASAIVAYQGHTSLYTDATGKFTTDGLPDGQYTFSVKADGYKDGTCTATVAKAADTTADCGLEALPKVGRVVGTVRDADSNAPIGGVTITMSDANHKQYTVVADPGGAFHFDSIPPGAITITVNADGYLADVQQGNVEVRKDNQNDVILHAKPRTAQVEVTAQEIKIKQQIQFATGSAVIKPESFGLMSEIADVFIKNPQIRKVEVQGHTDNVGPADYNRQLSQERADAVRLWLTQHGVAADRMIAKGYGADKPLVPNVTEAFRAKNRRVQFIILDQGTVSQPAPPP